MKMQAEMSMEGDEAQVGTSGRTWHGVLAKVPKSGLTYACKGTA